MIPGDCQSEVARQEGSPDDSPVRHSEVVHNAPRDGLRGGGGQAQDRLHTQLLPDDLGQPEGGLGVTRSDGSDGSDKSDRSDKSGRSDGIDGIDYE